MTLFWAGLVLCALVAWWLTGLLRRYALRRRLLDIPNARSSHAVPMPRGGGLSIVIVTCVALVLLWLSGTVAASTVVGFLGSGLMVAVVGYRDDVGHVPAAVRLLIHFIAAAWGLWWLGGAPPLVFFGTTLGPDWIGSGLALVFLVWLLNLFNFMDGIDGLAASEAATVCLMGAGLYVLRGTGAEGQLALIVGFASVGFLIWNFPPAKIFMGDAGSGFLGLVIGMLAIQAGHVAPELLWGWVILTGVFIADATVTLLRRVLRGEMPHHAHRIHAYQWQARRLRSHRAVTLAVVGLNILWLLPVAVAVVLGVVEGITGVLVAYGVLLLIALTCGAGRRESEIQNTSQ